MVIPHHYYKSWFKYSIRMICNFDFGFRRDYRRHEGYPEEQIQPIIWTQTEFDVLVNTVWYFLLTQFCFYILNKSENSLVFGLSREMESMEYHKVIQQMENTGLFSLR